MLISMYCILHRRDLEERRKQMISLEQKEMERMYALLPVSQDIKRSDVFSMLSVLISLN